MTYRHEKGLSVEAQQVGRLKQSQCGNTHYEIAEPLLITLTCFNLAVTTPHANYNELPHNSKYFYVSGQTTWHGVVGYSLGNSRRMIVTRINVVPVECLTDKHLMAEYRELPRIFTAVLKAQEQGKTPKDFDVPSSYCLGKGHVTFFYNKIGWLFNRFTALSLLPA